MKVTFSHRILGGLAMMALLLILIGYFAFATTRDLQSTSRAIMKENVSSLKAAEELGLALLNQKGVVSSYILNGDSEWLRTLEEKKKDFDLWLRNAQEVALTPEEKKILQEIRSLYKVYDTQRNKAIRLYQMGDVAESQRILLSDMKNSIDLLYQKCEELIFVNEVLIAKAEVSSQKRASRMTLLIWSTIVATLCLGVFVGFLIAREIGKQLVYSARLASLGQLSANIAHEIRNPLAAIKMRLYSLQEELKNTPSAKEDVNVIGEEIDRMEKTVKNFLEFSRPPEPSFQNHSIHQILEGTLHLLFPKAASQGIEIQKKWDTSIPNVAVDREQIRQAFLNILLNAFEAMPEGGSLEIATSMNGDRSSNRILEIEFRDTGKGISPKLKKRLFEPFVTNKEDGTGLGLFIASRIIQMHKGLITIDSQKGKGTRVSVKLPIILKDTNSQRV